MTEHFYESIDGWFNFVDIYKELASELFDGSSLVEVGSWYGRSAAFLAVEIARSGKSVQFHCVDTWRGSIDTPWMAEHLGGGSAFETFSSNMRRGGVEHLIRPIEQRSVDAASTFAASSLDFVMIDAAHDFESVRDDVRAWFPKVKPGGVIAGDDADWPGVLIAVRETIPDSELLIRNGGANWWHRKARPERGSWQFRRSATNSDVLAYIPFVNRPDLLTRALMSARALWPVLVVLDQSTGGIGEEFWASVPGARERLAGVFRVAKGAMTFTQMMNWAQQEAAERAARYLVFMHNDAEITAPALIERVLARVRSSADVGVVFTNYDAFCVFNCQATRETGPWDETFQWYFSDNDYYRRLLRCGFRIEHAGPEGVLHHCSQTMKDDAELARKVDSGWRWHADHYAHKWGGPPGAEVHLLPYGGRAW